MTRFLIPLALFASLLVLLALGLRRDPDTLPSPLINKPAPAFQLPQLHEPAKSFSPQEMIGKVWLLNVWASWCVSCREEHPLLLELARSRAVLVYGFNYKDQRNDAIAWLDELGDPYLLSAADLDGRVGIDYGVYGAPETYLIDREGVIRFKHVGPLTPEVLQNKLLPLARDLNK